MAHGYQTLTDEQRQQMIRQRLVQYESEHYNHELNKMALSTQPDSPSKEKALREAEEAQEVIEAAIASLEAHLVEFDDD